jgi:hypothetical protein
MRANLRSKDDETGGEVAKGERLIFENPPVMGIFPDIAAIYPVQVPERWKND